MNLHHVHIFASDLSKTLDWWVSLLDAEIVLDTEHAGARNVLIRVGSGHLNIYDQAPPETGRSAIHHLGVAVDDLKETWPLLRSKGAESPNGLREFGSWRYVMVEAPDSILVELFEFDDAASPFRQPTFEATIMS